MVRREILLDESAIYPLGLEESMMIFGNQMRKANNQNMDHQNLKGAKDVAHRQERGLELYESEIAAHKEATKLIELDEKEHLRHLFNIDHIELESIMQEWNARRPEKLVGPSVCIDMDYLVVRDSVEQSFVEDHKCSLCLGLVRDPVSLCKECQQPFCSACINETRLRHDKHFNSEVIDDFGMAGANLLVPFPCPMCRCQFREQLPRL
mmetsp:Transcript_12702/g.21391  ORF Transcript_12702/g.21391 Transcript_12702/m.21391 type:complete len:208 (+) Transcript_12702:273-896(+)